MEDEHAIDISQRLGIEKTLQKSEEKFKAIFNNARDGILVSDIETKKFVLGNAMIYKMLGYSQDEVMTMGVEDIHPPENLPEVFDRFEKLVRQETILEVDIPVKRRDGSLFLADINTFLIEFNGKTCLVGFFRDTTERKSVEEALRESQRDLNRAQAVANTGSWRLDLRRNELIWSEETGRIFGIALDTPMKYEIFLSLVHPEDREFVDREWTAALSGKPYDIEHRIVVGDTVKWVRERAELDFDRQGALLGGFGTVQDITERKQSEEALRESEERFRLAFENANIGMALVGINGRYLRVNDTLSDMLGYSREELERMGVRDLTHPDDLQLSKDFRMQILRREIGNAQFEKRKVHRNGKIVWVQIASSLVRDPQGKPLYFISQVQNITARKKAEEELRRVLAGLELRVQERTQELRQTVAQLQQEVTERQRAEETIRESEAKLRSLTQRVLALQEKERQQLSWELQEDLAQYITALKLELYHFEPKLPESDEKLRQSYRQALNKINIIVENLRRRAMDLSPQLLTDLGLTLGLKSMFENFARVNNIECDLHLEELKQFFNAADQISIYRVFEEALENIVQHAAATKVTLAAKSEDGKVKFLVEDNGHGFDAAIVEGRQGVGLSAMAERVRALGGTFKLESQRAAGTRILFTIPQDRERNFRFEPEALNSHVGGTRQ